MSKKLLVIIGSYRRDGIIHQAVHQILGTVGENRAELEIEVIDLLDKQVAFCTNCRACTQLPGEKPGSCILEDDMGAIVSAVESADYLILGAPINCFNVTALFRRFMERLICYVHWPWGKMAPRLRIKKGGKKALVIASSAMPGVLQPFFTGAPRALKATARQIGAEKVAVLSIGGIVLHSQQKLSQRTVARIKKSVDGLLD